MKNDNKCNIFIGIQTKTAQLIHSHSDLTTGVRLLAERNTLAAERYEALLKTALSPIAAYSILSNISTECNVFFSIDCCMLRMLRDSSDSFL